MAEQVEDFCRRVCVKLQCCPNLFGPTLVSEKCPENCSVHTKTKYSKCLRADWEETAGKRRDESIKRRRCILRVGKEIQEISAPDRYFRKERNIERNMFNKREREREEREDRHSQRQMGGKKEETNSDTC